MATRSTRPSRLRSAIFTVLAVSLAGVGAGAPDLAHRGAAIPAFARKYRTSCTTCHVAPPKLNVLGEAFRLNGYRFPGNDELLRRDEPVELGAEEWRDLWPRAIWPGELPEAVPLAIRLTNDANLVDRSSSPTELRLELPEAVTVLAATSLGDAVSVFVETEISGDGEIEVEQAKIQFQNVLPGLPFESVNVMVGRQVQRLFTFTDRAIDRAGRVLFSWQSFGVGDASVADPADGSARFSDNPFRLGSPRAAIELNGLASRRVYFGLGLAQEEDGNLLGGTNQGQFFYKLRYKLGGLALDGTYDDGEEPVIGGGGQLQDNSLILEHFGYAGRNELPSGGSDSFRAFGFAARLLHGPFDIGVGYVRGEDDTPFAGFVTGSLDHNSVFARAEYQVFPWLIGSLKYDDFDMQANGALAGSVSLDRPRRLVVPGVIALVRQNIRGVLEMGVADPGAGEGARFSNLWLRLDMAF